MIKPLNRQIDSSKESIYVLLLAAIQFAHMVDFVVMMPLGPTLMKDFNITPAQFSTLVSSYNFSAAIMGVFLGAFADRYDRRNLLNLSLFGFAMGTLFCSWANTFNLLLLGRIIAGSCGGMVSALVYSILTDLVPYERRGRAMGIVMSSFSVASVVGVPLGLAIADYSSWHFSFVFIGVFSLVILLLSYLYIPILLKPRQNEKENFLVMYWNVLSRREYFYSFALMSFASGSMFLLIPFLSPYAVQNMKIDQEMIKYAYLIGGGFTIISAQLIGKATDRMSAFKLYITLLLLSFIPVWIFTNSGETSPVVYFTLSSFFMMLVSGRMIPCMTFISKVPREEDRGGFMSVLNSVRSFGAATMTLFAGAIIGQDSAGELTHFDQAGYLAIAMGLATVYFGYRICSRELVNK